MSDKDFYNLFLLAGIALFMGLAGFFDLQPVTDTPTAVEITSK
jgi:hypothetical protein